MTLMSKAPPPAVGAKWEVPTDLTLVSHATASADEKDLIWKW